MKPTYCLIDVQETIKKLHDLMAPHHKVEEYTWAVDEEQLEDLKEELYNLMGFTIIQPLNHQ